MNSDNNKMSTRRKPANPTDPSTNPDPRSSGNLSIPAPILVQTPGELAEMLDHLADQPLIAVDTESDSLFRYYPRICLIQVSAPAPPGTEPDPVSPIPVVDYLVDPLHLPAEALRPLGEILADPQVEVIFHAAENDLILLERDFGFRVRRIFDTQLAARILGRRGVGLDRILEEEFGVISNKKMRRTNWGQRPLTPQQMTYAQLDTHFLPALRARQLRALEAAGRLREAQEAFRALEKIRYTPPKEPRSFWSMKGLRDVPQADLPVLQALWEWREAEAQQQDRPPFKIVNDSVLRELAAQRPRRLADLAQIRGLSERQRRRYGRRLLEVIAEGEQRPVPEPPEQMNNGIELSRTERRLYDALRRWRTERAQARGVDPDIVMSNHELLAIVRQRPRTMAELTAIPTIGEWKAQTYGVEILEILRSGKKR